MALSTQNGRQPIISGRGISKIFQLGDQWVHALNGVDLDIPQGQFIAIMGPSGSGKSTLLYMLGGLDRSSEGSITIAGQDISQFSGEELAGFRRDTIGFIFQAFHLVPTMTALENVGLPGVFAAMPREERDRRAFKLLAALGMDERTDHRPSQLSGGQQQRVAIARALFNNPPIIMADEPTGALDSKTGTTVMQMLRHLCRKQGKTIVIVTHDPGVARYADRMLLLRDGQVIEDRMQTPNRRTLEDSSPFKHQNGHNGHAAEANGHAASENGMHSQNGHAATENGLHGTNGHQAESNGHSTNDQTDDSSMIRIKPSKKNGWHGHDTRPLVSEVEHAE